METPDQDSEIVALLTDHQAALRLYVASLLPGESSAPDVAQQANATIWKKRNDFEIGTNFKAWVFAIARYEVLNFRKQQARDSRRLMFSDELEEIIAAEMEHQVEDFGPRQGVLQGCLEKLKPKDRELIQHRYFERITLKEYAAAIGRSPGGLKVSLHRLRNTLRLCIEKQLPREGGRRMKGDEPEKLIDDLIDGDISEADFLRLEAEMIVSEEVRQAYYDRQKLNTALQIDAESQAGAGVSTPAAASGPNRRLRFDWLMACGLLALLFVVGVIGWRIGQSSDNGRALKEEPVATGFGVLAAQSEAVWADRSNLGKGDLLPAGTLQLESGVAELELFSGVVLLVEGEAEFEVVSPNDFEMVKGRLRAQVPEMKEGFRIWTPSGEVAGSGSDFVMEVNGGRTDLHLLSGEISWQPDSGQPDSGPPQTVAVGKSMRWDGAAGKAVEEFVFDAATLNRLGTFEQELTDRQADQLQQWEQHSRSLRDDPRLIAYFPMDQEGKWNRQLNDASGSKIHGTIVRANRSLDRWGRPYAGLDFSPMGSRVRLTMPGDHQSLTFMCWVRIASLDRLYNSLFLTDGHELHEPHWQLMNDGRMFFSVKAGSEKGKPDKHIAFSPPIWTPAQSGQWMHLATVYDGEAFTTTHYVNGEAVSIDQIPEEYHPEKVVIGAASIGNWSEPRYRQDAEFAVRNLNGSIDEFALFSAPLSAAEIREIYEVGKP